MENLLIEDFYNKTVSELVVADYRRAEVFKKFGVDFCCGGKRMIKEVCNKKSIDSLALFEELIKIDHTSSELQQQEFNNLSLDSLVDHIINVHHKYVRENIPLLKEFTTKVARVHGESFPETVQIAQLFSTVTTEMEQHMLKEEQILFPYIKQIDATSKDQTPNVQPLCGSINRLVRIMENDHDQVGELMKHIHKLSSNFTSPNNACNTFRVSYLKLQEFEEDLHQHIHLENNILFPKAIDQGSKLLSNQRN